MTNYRKLRARSLTTIDKAIEGQPPTPESREPSTARALRDWKADPSILEPPVITIPHLAVDGRTTLISGLPKAGKSTVVGGAVSDASQGRPVLGVPVLGCVKTLCYNNDEPMSDTVRRFDRLDADPDMVILNDMPRSIAEVRAALEIDVGEFDPDLFVLDNFSRVLAMSGVDPNSSRDVEPVIAGLVDFLHRQGLSAILLYHTGKSGRDYRGSTAIGATVDEILTLRRRGQSDEDDFEDEGNDDGRRLLIQDGRNLRGRLHLNFVDGVYQIYQESHAPREKILEVLRVQGSVSGRGELAKLAGVRKSAGLEAIAELIVEGRITETHRRLSLGSAGFPDGGTSRERTSGTVSQLATFAGSQIGNPPSAEMGTLSPNAERSRMPISRSEEREIIERYERLGVA